MTPSLPKGPQSPYNHHQNLPEHAHALGNRKDDKHHSMNRNSNKATTTHATSDLESETVDGSSLPRNNATIPSPRIPQRPIPRLSNSPLLPFSPPTRAPFSHN
ncbi:hypothetical protein M758_1G204500 [Ceratodon purpureus]|nr:hypothetical protein M758_1G204500 [Ceratodon purpureus]